MIRVRLIKKTAVLSALTLAALVVAGMPLAGVLPTADAQTRLGKQQVAESPELDASQGEELSEEFEDQTPFEFQGTVYENERAFIKKARCGSHLSELQMETIERLIDAERQVAQRRRGYAAFTAGRIPVYFHIVRYSNGTGGVSTSTLDAQINALNAGFASTGYTFYRAGANAINNSTYAACRQGTTEETNMKTAFYNAATTTFHNGALHFYCVPNPRNSAGSALLGWARFPWDYSASNGRILDGVVIQTGSMPGGSTAKASPTSGCPSSRNSCTSISGNDPIHNFMDYSYDSCLWEFTAGQDARMDSLCTTYRSRIATN
jgi:hypothetical protein